MNLNAHFAAAVLALHVTSGMAQDAPPSAPATPAAAASATVGIKAATMPSQAVPFDCTPSVQNTAGAFWGSVAQKYVQKHTGANIQGLDKVAGRTVEAAIKTEQPECARLPKSSTEVLPAPSVAR